MLWFGLDLSLLGLSDAPDAPQAVVMGGQYDVDSCSDARGGLPDYHPQHRLVVYHCAPALVLIRWVPFGQSAFGTIYRR